jgi:hypothetical protein
MAKITSNGTIIADALEASATDDATVYADVRPVTDGLSVRVTLAPSTNAPCVIDQAGAEALVRVLIDEAAQKFPGWTLALA